MIEIQRSLLGLRITTRTKPVLAFDASMVSRILCCRGSMMSGCIPCDSVRNRIPVESCYTSIDLALGVSLCSCDGIQCSKYLVGVDAIENGHLVRVLLSEPLFIL